MKLHSFRQDRRGGSARSVAVAGLILASFAAAFGIWNSRRDAPAVADFTDKKAEAPEMVRVSVFDSAGTLVGPMDSPKLVLSDEEWQKRLTPEQYQVARDKGTERPFCGTLLDNKKEGVYACVCCGLPLFSSNSKFDSGTGWPSFFQPIAKGNVAEHSDFSHGWTRTEILCARCDCHLGHVFDDAPSTPTGLRFCLNSASLAFTPEGELAKLADPLASAASGKATSPGKAPGSGKTAQAIFGGGCFWCTEAAFEQLDGVIDAESGYSGGTKETANYERVCMGDTGHAEVIRITYDPEKIGFERLLDVFFDSHDPTTLNRQGNDIGSQYRSAVFYSTPEEKQIAEAKIKQLNEKKTFSKPIVTTLEPLTAYYPAEDYHQDYARANPFNPYIQSQAMPKVCKVRDKHADLIKPGK